jgi:hypothetical protein
MGHFAKHWPAELVEEVEEVVRKRISHLIFCLSLLLTNSMLLKFVERYERNNQQQPHTTRVCKAAVLPPKLGHRYTDDSDLSSDESDCQQATNVGNTYMEEWKLYLNTNEVVPDDMRIVRWWGVGLTSFFSEFDLTSVFSSYMAAAIRHGSHLHVTTFQSWHPLF